MVHAWKPSHRHAARPASEFRVGNRVATSEGQETAGDEQIGVRTSGCRRGWPDSWGRPHQLRIRTGRPGGKCSGTSASGLVNSRDGKSRASRSRPAGPGEGAFTTGTAADNPTAANDVGNGSDTGHAPAATTNGQAGGNTSSGHRTSGRGPTNIRPRAIHWPGWRGIRPDRNARDVWRHGPGFRAPSATFAPRRTCSHCAQGVWKGRRRQGQRSAPLGARQQDGREHESRATRSCVLLI
jgi:hypothetical protein